ncbi:hypothetical protein [Spirulina subsalsa]|nr:hypothetical protein [Spirulina subsalsa]
MSPINPYTLRMQITRMFEQNQTFFVEQKERRTPPRRRRQVGVKER